MIDQREAVNQLYTNPVFKSKFWEDAAVFNEQTPLLKENIESVLNIYSSFSKVYESIFDYMNECKTKDYPQVVGLNGEDMSHWIAIQKKHETYHFIDSSGCPKECYSVNEVPDIPPNYIATEAGHIRQSPKANSCGLYALTYCLAYELEDSPYRYWIDYAPKTIDYLPVDLLNFTHAYSAAYSGYYLYSNDINLYNFYNQINKSE